MLKTLIITTQLFTIDTPVLNALEKVRGEFLTCSVYYDAKATHLNRLQFNPPATIKTLGRLSEATNNLARLSAVIGVSHDNYAEEWQDAKAGLESYIDLDGFFPLIPIYEERCEALLSNPRAVFDKFYAKGLEKVE